MFNFLVHLPPNKATLRSHLVHASDADQAEALLTRWGPDRLGKLGGQPHQRIIHLSS